MRRFLRDAAILAVLGVIAATAVVSFGLYNPSAALGHLPGVSWVLHTTYRNAVETWSRDYPKPDLTDLGLIQRGAGHYRSYCADCHSAPGRSPVFIARSMVPPPPHIADAVAGWDANELFWIVKNGVKMTGMPAWPSQVRDDEVWSVVAFLLRVPDLSEEVYLDLAFGEARTTRSRERAADGTDAALIADCAGCHGADGRGRGTGAAPRLDIQDEGYLYASLKAYAQGARPSGIMQPVAYALSDAQMQTVARHFASLGTNAAVDQPAPAADRIARGRSIATSGTAGPSCASCHGPWPTRRSVLYPELAGQYEGYLLDQLRLWKRGVRGGTERAHLMRVVAEQLAEDDMVALAAYYASWGR